MACAPLSSQGFQACRKGLVTDGPPQIAGSGAPFPTGEGSWRQAWGRGETTPVSTWQTHTTATGRPQLDSHSTP